MLYLNHESNKNFKAPIIGALTSLGLTLFAYFVAVKKYHATSWDLVLLLMVLAVVQVCLQIVFFYNIGAEEKPRWSLMTFLFMVLVIIIVVTGSIWIMHNVNYNLMPDLNT